MIFEQIRTGGDRNFAYLVGDETSKQGALVDPSFSPLDCIARASQHGLQVIYLINTHSHYDHTNGNDVIQKKTGAQLICWGGGSEVSICDGDVFSMGSLHLRFIHTPGHTEDGICILAEGHLITGDTLFVGKVGGTDYDAGARKEFQSLKRLMELPGETTVWPGHDYGTAPSSTIAHEKEANPFILCRSFEEFVDLKMNWIEYKRKHGIR